MKRFGTLFSLFLFCVAMFSQGSEGYIQQRKGSRVRYAVIYANKLRGHVERTVTDVSDDGGKHKVTHLYTMLNKKGKPSKSAALMGAGDGMQTSVTVEDGAYYLTLDLMYGSMGNDNRSGYLLKMPKTLKVGDELEGGTLKASMKFMGSTINNEVTFKNFKVTEETTLQTKAGDIKCLKITGRITGRVSRQNVDEEQTLYVAPGIGIVRQEAMNYMGSKTPYLSEVTEFEGI